MSHDSVFTNVRVQAFTWISTAEIVTVLTADADYEYYDSSDEESNESEHFEQEVVNDIELFENEYVFAMRAFK